MINIYALTDMLEQGPSIFQLSKLRETGLWYPVTNYKKPSDEITITTNIFIPDQPKYHIQLTSNYDSKEWEDFLEKNQWKLYPLLARLLKVFLPDNKQLSYTIYNQSILTVETL